MYDINLSVFSTFKSSYDLSCVKEGQQIWHLKMIWMKDPKIHWTHVRIIERSNPGSKLSRLLFANVFLPFSSGQWIKWHNLISSSNLNLILAVRTHSVVNSREFEPSFLYYLTVYVFITGHVYVSIVTITSDPLHCPLSTCPSTQYISKPNSL